MTHTFLGVPYYKFLDFNKTLKMDAKNISSTSSVYTCHDGSQGEMNAFGLLL